PGLRDESALESALARPKNKWSHGKVRDPAVLAAACGFGIVTAHPYSDGNKRVGFLAIVTFLGINDYEFTAPEIRVLQQIMHLAAGEVSEDKRAGWIRDHITRINETERRDRS